MSEYRYDAFISYRHGGRDQFVAENLHRLLETFKLPTNIEDKTNGKKKIERVFRDQEELPLASNLGDPIQDALRDSEWLIVICSPRLKESRWCQTEIETFIKMHGIEKVLAVLVEGEPSESFPEQLLYKEVEVTAADGTVSLEKVPMEPLAADMRGETNKDVMKAMKLEMLRLLAPIFGVSFDDLRQRHRERRLRRIVALTSMAAAIMLVFGLVSGVMAVRIAKQNVKITAQAKALAVSTAETLAEKSTFALETGDRVGAVKTAVSALTSFEGVEMPYTADAQLALADSIYAYHFGQNYVPAGQLSTLGTVNDFVASADGKHLIASDNAGYVYVFDVDTFAEVMKYETGITMGEDDIHQFAFVDDDRVIFAVEGEGAKLYTISTGEMSDVAALDGKSVSQFVTVRNGANLWCAADEEILGLDVANLSVKKKIDTGLGIIGYVRILNVSVDEKQVVFKTSDLKSFGLVCYDVASGEKTELDVEGVSASCVRIWNDTVYALCNDIKSLTDSDYSAIVYSFNVDGTMNWKYVEDNAVGSYIRPAVAEGADQLLLTTYSNAILVDQNTGELTVRNGIESSTVFVAAYASSSMYSIITRAGDLIVITPENKTAMESTLFKDCVGNLRMGLIGAGGIFTQSYLSNKITVYKDLTAEGMEEYSGDVDEAEFECYTYSEAKDYVKDFNIEEKDMVASCVVIEKGKFAIVSYATNTSVIYDVSKGEIISTVDENMRFDRYYGKDKAGNYYIGEPGDAIVLNSNFEQIAHAQHMVGLLEKENRIVVEKYSERYSLPILSLEEMIKVGKEVAE